MDEMKTFYVADRKDLSNKELGNEFFYRTPEEMEHAKV